MQYKTLITSHLIIKRNREDTKEGILINYKIGNLIKEEDKLSNSLEINMIYLCTQNKQ